MNIPEIKNEIKQGLHSESVVPTKVVDKPPTHSENAMVNADAVHKLSDAQADKQSSSFSKGTLNSLIQEAEEHLEANNIKLKFNVLEEDDQVQVVIVDDEGKTIRKIPGDDLLKLSQSLKNIGKGFLDETS